MAHIKAFTCLRAEKKIGNHSLYRLKNQVAKGEG